MKKVILIALLAVLAATGGVFAYTFTTATATIGVTAIESDFANVTANVTAFPTTRVFGTYIGTWPEARLFDISPHADYTGDLVIHVYLVNTGELIRQYHHLNMKLQYQDSDNNAVDYWGRTEVLTLQNADVAFYAESDNGTAPYHIQLTGGGYRLHRWKTLAGGSVQPQLYCEVTQR